MFDAAFYRTALPALVRAECEARPERVPVVELHLASGRVLDLCHISHLADAWVACHYFRDTETCEEMDVAFLPYGLISMVTVSLHHPEKRRLGFDVSSGSRPLPATTSGWGGSGGRLGVSALDDHPLADRRSLGETAGSEVVKTEGM